jgi:hypothetical protein
MARKGWMYVAHYRCGCLEEAYYRKDLLGYCGTHGQDLLEPIAHLPDNPKDLTPQVTCQLSSPR